MKSLESLLNEAVANIEQDREITKELLEDVIKYLSKNEANHREVGVVAAKYVETLQRSNEQLVKIAAMLQKKTNTDENLSEKDREELFDLIKNSESKK